MRLVGIRRSAMYSPGGHAENDRRIFDAVVHALERHGCKIRVMDDDDVGVVPIRASAIFSMCQGSRANSALEQLIDEGALIMNAPQAVQNCHRARLYCALGEDRGIFAPMTLVSTSTHAEPAIPSGLSSESSFWIKRGDVHATQPGDVVRVGTVEAYRAVLDGFRGRGIGMAAVVPHLAGEVVKFYGVLGSSFFRFYCEADSRICPVAFASAQAEIEHLVRRVGLEIYGGDAVLTAEGRVVVIDINDWPTFARFRDEAAEAIAHHIYSCALRHDLQFQGRQDSSAIA